MQVQHESPRRHSGCGSPGTQMKHLPVTLLRMPTLPYAITSSGAAFRVMPTLPTRS